MNVYHPSSRACLEKLHRGILPREAERGMPGPPPVAALKQLLRQLRQGPLRRRGQALATVRPDEHPAS